MLDHILAQAQEDAPRALERLRRFIRQRSISAENIGHAEMCALLAAEVEALGGTAEVVPGVDFPILYGRINAGAPRTLLIHSMYDTTPAEEAGWLTDPFAATVMELPGKGECLVARGAEDTKGPVAAVFAMIEAHRRAEVELPVNLILVFEASELGSRSMAPFIESRREELADADLAYWPWHSERADGTGVVWLGCKGLMTFKLHVRGGEWGGPRGADLHGLHSGWVANPIHRLAAAIASFKDAGDLEIAIEGFYGEGDPVTAEDEAMIERLVQRLDPQAILHDLDVARFKQRDFRAALHTHCFRSEFNVSGIQGGVVIEGGGTKVLLPPSATASLDLRPLDGMTIPQVMGAIRDYLDRHGFPEVEIELLNGYVGGRMRPSNWAVQELLGAYRDIGTDPEVWPRTATAIGVSLFTRTLGIPWIGTCPGHSGGKHAANEFLQVAGFHRAVGFMIRLLWRIAAARG